MWTRILVIVLVAFVIIPGSLHSQEAVNKTRQEPCPDKEVAPSGPGLTVKERHGSLRRDREEDFAVVLCSPQLPYGGCGYDPHPSQTGIVPLTFDIDSAQGLTVRYRDGLKYRAFAPGTPIRFRHGNRVLLLKMKAGANAPLGVQRLHGTLTFQTVEPGKADSTQQIAVDFQVTIVNHDDQVTDYDWPFGSQVGRHMKDVALAPLLPFEFLMLAIACSASACDL
jgi:hypothetical protein